MLVGNDHDHVEFPPVGYGPPVPVPVPHLWQDVVEVVQVVLLWL